MRGLSCGRVFGAALICTSAAILGAALTPQEGSSRVLCPDQICRYHPDYCRTGVEDMYCHVYPGIEGCWDGECGPD